MQKTSAFIVRIKKPANKIYSFMVAVWPVLSKLSELADVAVDSLDAVLRPDDPALSANSDSHMAASAEPPPSSCDTKNKRASHFRTADIISPDDSQLNPQADGATATTLTELPTHPKPSRRGYRARPLSPDALAEAVRRYQSGETLRAIAASLGISRDYLTNQLRTMPGFVVRHRSMRDDEVRQAVYLYGTGLSVTSIGQRLGFNAGTIWLALRKVGVPMRDEHGRER